MNSWEFKFWTDPDTKKNHFKFGNEVTAEAGCKPPLNWIVRFGVAQPKASSVVVGAGLVAQTQRDCYGSNLIASYFDITSALGEAISAGNAQDIAAIGARVELGWLQLSNKLARERLWP